MKKFLAVLLIGISASYAQVPVINTGTSGVTPPTGVTTIRQMNDDGFAHVPLQFGFPYFGKTFTNSFMYDNGVVGFFAPATATTTAVGCDPAITFCGGNNWGSQQFTTTISPTWNYMIAPLHTDLVPTAGSVYSTTGNANQMTYRWENVGEYYNPSNLNTFSLQIKPSGFIGVNYEKINIGQSTVSVGLVGDASKGEFSQQYFMPAGNLITTNSIPSWNVLSTGDDQCTVDPLSSATCSGYASAYLTQQCTISALYSPSCPGYVEAYFTQQCMLNPLYEINCPGYAAAYLEYQCSINPLYSTTCLGYEKAYFDQQCTISGLYDQKCPNYAESYTTKMLLEKQRTATTVATTGVVSQTAPLPTTDSSGEVKVALVADSNVNSVITTSATSASAAQAATPVPLVAAPPPAAPAPQEKKPEGSLPQMVQVPSGGSKTQPTARQAIAERRAEAAKKEAVEKGKNLANEMGKAADMESQKQIQNVVMQAMAFTPGFDAYSKASVPDVAGYKPFTVYNNQKTIDNRANLRMFGGTDKLHQEMVDEQYNRK